MVSSSAPVQLFSFSITELPRYDWYRTPFSINADLARRMWSHATDLWSRDMQEGLIAETLPERQICQRYIISGASCQQMWPFAESREDGM